MRMKRFCVVLMLVAVVLPGGLVGAQGSEIITVTGLYISNPDGEYESVLHPCHVFEIWDVVDSPAFTTLSQAYAGMENSGQLTKYGQLFVEVRGRYTAYEEKVHTDGFFEITELVRHSTAAADITACEWTCERIYGVNAPTCLAQVDGQCGSTLNSCVTGDYLDYYAGDTATHYRWDCAGSYGGDSVVCTAPKAVLRGTEDREQK